MHTVADNRWGKGCDDRSVGDIEVRLSEESFHD